MSVRKAEKDNTLLICTFIVLISLFFIYVIKYYNQGLSLSHFTLNTTGNLLNLISAVVLAAGILILYFSKKTKLENGTILVLSVIMTAALGIAFALTKIDLPVKNIYILEQPLQRLLIGLFFTSYQFVQIMLISLVWIIIIGRPNIIYLRAVTNSILIVLLLLVFAFIYSVNKGKAADEQKLDENKRYTAVVLGAAVWSNNLPSPSLKARLRKALELYRSGIVNKVQLTGSNAPGELPESEVAFRYLREVGVSESDILLETKTTSTTEQISFIKFYLMRNIPGDIIIVSDKYHLARILEICDFYDIEVVPSASNLQASIRTNIYNRLRETIAITIFWFFAI